MDYHAPIDFQQAMQKKLKTNAKLKILFMIFFKKFKSVSEKNERKGK